MSRPITTPRVPPKSADATPLRRCTFRRVTVVARPGGLPVNQFACTFPDRLRQVSLGDIDEARPICQACTYPGIFRPDAD
jgi:hypothetical protein